MGEDGGDLVGAGFGDGEVGGYVAEGDVEDCAVLGGVDVLAGEHFVADLFDLGFAGEGEEGGEDRLGDEVFGVVEEESGWGGAIWGCVFFGEGGEAGWVLCEEVFEDEVLVLGVVDLLEFLPRWVFCGIGVRGCG